MKAKSRYVCRIGSPNSIMGLSVHDSSYFSFFMIFCSSELIKYSWNTWFIAVSCVSISFSNFWCECITRERGKFNDHKTIFKQHQCYVYDWKIIITYILFYLTGAAKTFFKHGTPVQVHIFIWHGRITYSEMLRKAENNRRWQQRTKLIRKLQLKNEEIKTSNSVTRFPYPLLFLFYLIHTIFF